MLRSFLTPLLQSRHHIDSYTSIDQHILQLLVGTELFISQWRHQYGLNALCSHHFCQVLIRQEHLLSQQISVFKIFFVRDKSLHNKLCWLCVAQILGKTNSAIFHTIDQCAFGIATCKGDIISSLHQYSKCPQGNRWDNIHGKDMTGT